MLPSAPTGSAAIASSRPFMKTVASLGVSVGIFGVVFLLLAIGIVSLITPDRFPVTVGDRTVRLDALTSEQERLKQDRDQLNTARAALLTDDRSATLRQVAALRARIVPVGSVLASIEETRRSFLRGSADPITIPGVTFDGVKGKLTLSGDVHDPDGRSMQLLASFVDALRTLPLVRSVTEPEYRMLPGTGTETVSPFTVTLTLAHSS